MSRPVDVDERAPRIRLLALDVDGVLTDGRLYYGESGESLKAFHARDGLGLRLLLDEGVEVAVITARRSPIVTKRCEELRIRRVFVGRDDKRSVLAELSSTLGIEPEAMAFVGDDVLDLPALRFVGLPIAVADAHPRVRAEAALVTALPGGTGAVREVADRLLASRGRLDAAIDRLFSPNVFAPCTPSCGGAHCLPESLVPVAGRSVLSACTAPYGAGYCVPDKVIASGGNGVPTTCNAVPGASVEGRCLSDCLPGIAAIASSLSVDVCATGEHCVPCFDPFTGVSTGACTSVSCDMPAQPAYTFPTCCPSGGTDQATCLPSATIPSAVQPALQPLTCPSSFLCVPDELVPERGVTAQTCGIPAQPSTCVSRCFAGVPANAPQGSCPANHACLRCSLLPAGTPGCP